MIRFFFSISALLFILTSYAQECGSDELHAFKMQNDAVYKAQFEQRQHDILELLSQSNREQLEPVVIPVVVHVIHMGETPGVGSNISDSQVINAITGLNERYANINNLGVDIEVQFCLASRDPEGCTTNGINRVDGSVLQGYTTFGVDYPDGVECGGPSDEEVKDLSAWPVSEYYNIWVVHSICEGWAGYAYYPNGDPYDGTVMVDNYMAYNYPTLAHELGHGLNLAHTFNGDEGNSVCPANDNCMIDGDYVCDTPPHKQSDCGGDNPCTSDDSSWDNSRKNFMSYCGGTDRFTLGQKLRMQATLEIFPRASLLTSMGCVPSDFATQTVIEAIDCQGNCNGSVSAFPSCSGNFTYLWSTGDTTQTIEGLCPGTYDVIITDEFNNAAAFSAEVPEAVAFEIAIDSAYTICAGESLQLEVSGEAAFSWFPPDGLDNSSISDPVTQPDETITYTITGISENGCIDSTQVTVIVNDNPDATIVQSIDTLFAQPSGMDYQWYMDGELMEGETGEFLVAGGDGNYSVVITDENGCSGESQTLEYVGIDLINPQFDLVLYPNPAEGNITINFNSPSNLNSSVQVFDAVGKMVHIQPHQFAPGKNLVGVNLTSLAAGSYVLKIKNGTYSVEKEFVLLK